MVSGEFYQIFKEDLTPILCNLFKKIMNIFTKPTARLRRGEILNAFCPRLETRQECLLSSFLFTTVLEFIASVIRQEKEKAYSLEKKK